VADLTDRQQWSIMERVNHRNACHFFLACRADRPESTFAINFDAADYLGYTPHYRHRCGINGQTIYKPNWKFELSVVEAAVVGMIDGKRTISEITESALEALTLAQQTADPVIFTKDLIQRLWRTDYLAFEIAAQKTQGRRTAKQKAPTQKR
jgi:hypothetical protein